MTDLLVWGLLAIAWFAVFVAIFVGMLDEPGPPPFLDRERADDD